MVINILIFKGIVLKASHSIHGNEYIKNGGILFPYFHITQGLQKTKKSGARLQNVLYILLVENKQFSSKN